jgi:hypothetical protein
MGHIRTFEKCTLILEHCLKLSPDIEVLLLHDETVDPSLVETMSYAAASLKTKPLSLRYVPRRRLVMKEFGRFAGAWRFGEVIHDVVLGALREAGAIMQ